MHMHHICLVFVGEFFATSPFRARASVIFSVVQTPCLHIQLTLVCLIVYSCCLLCSPPADTVPTTPMNMSVRLAGGRTDYQGRVEVYRDNQWKLVCGSHWNQYEGDVVCRQLGFGYAVATTSQNTVPNFLNGSRSVWNASISCAGSERTLGECSVTQPATSSCALGNSVSVFCSGKRKSPLVHVIHCVIYIHNLCM